MKMTTKYNLKRSLAILGIGALSFFFSGCEKEKPEPNDPSNPQQPQKHNVELTYDRSLSILPIDTVYKYANQSDVDTIFLVPESIYQYSGFAASQLPPYMNALRKRHNIAPNRIFGKGDMYLNNTVQSEPAVGRFFADTLKYNVIYANKSNSK